MNLRLTVATLVSVSLTACATVDIADMASSGPVPDNSVVQEQNVVLRASTSLKDSFLKNGWTEARNPNIQKTANMLLHGADKSSEDIPAISSEPPMPTQTKLRTDIVYASEKVAKTVAAANIFLDMAEAGEDLKNELKALETALVLSRKAETHFESLCVRTELGTSVEELRTLSEVVDQLRESTDLYGDRVRQQSKVSQTAAF